MSENNEGKFIEIKGVSDLLEVHEDKVVITPKGVLGLINKGLKGSKSINFKSISSIQLKEAGSILSGYIQFGYMGGIESKGGIFSAPSDENTFMFTKEVNEEIKKVKKFIEEKINKNETSTNSSLADELTKLHSLYKSGAISKEEYRSLKDSAMKKSA